MNGFSILYHVQIRYMIHFAARQSCQHVNSLALIIILHLLRCIKSKNIDTCLKNISCQL